MRIPTISILLMGAWALTSQADQTFEIDPWWPKPLPEGWINGQVGGVCVDSRDNILIVGPPQYHRRGNGNQRTRAHLRHV